MRNKRQHFAYPPLELTSATFHSRRKTQRFKLYYPDSTLAPRHVRYHQFRVGTDIGQNSLCALKEMHRLA